MPPKVELKKDVLRKKQAYIVLNKLKTDDPNYTMKKVGAGINYNFDINGKKVSVNISNLNTNKNNTLNNLIKELNLNFDNYNLNKTPILDYNLRQKDYENFTLKNKQEQKTLKKAVKTPLPKMTDDEDLYLNEQTILKKALNTPLPITPFDENDIDPSKPSIGSKPSNDIDNINAADANVENNTNSGNSSKSNTTVVKDTPNITVNKQEQVEVRDNPLPNIVDNLTPASSSANAQAEVVNLKAQQETNVDSINPALPPSELAKRKRVKKVKLVNKNLTTEQQDITFNNLNVIRDSVNNNADMSNDGKKQINNLLDNIEKTVDTPQDVDVINELAGVMTKELEQGVENTTEDINTKLREFLTTYDPNLVDFSSPDATKQYALLTTHLLKQLSDKIEFFPQVEKGVKKVEKIQAEVNQGNNITKAGQINIEPQKEKQGSNPLIDGLYEKYIDFNGIKYLDLNDHHPSLVIGGLKL